MINRFTNSKYFKIIAVIFIALKFYTIWRKDNDYYSDMCKEIIPYGFKDKIIAVGGSGQYQWIKLANNKLFNVNFKEIKVTKGITNDYIDYKVGDSIFKEKNSNELKISRGNNYAIFILDCKN